MEKKTTAYLKPLLAIALPIMISNVISQIQMLIDRLFLARVDDIYMSALSNIMTPLWTSMSFVFSLSIGASIIISQSIGAGEKERAKEYCASLWKWHNGFGIFLFVVWFFFSKYIFIAMGVDESLIPMCMDYTKIYAPVLIVLPMGAAAMVTFQTSNYTMPLVFQGVLRSVLNIVLDWIFIFGEFGFPAMGMKGAAIATTIAEVVGAVVVLFFCVFKKDMISMPKLIQIVKGRFSNYITGCKLGVFTALEDFLWNGGNLVLIVILNSIDVMAAGIYSVVFTVEILAVVVIGSLGNGDMTLTGEAVGRKDSTQYSKVTRLAFLSSALVSFVTLVLCIVIPEQMIGLFFKDENIIKSSVIFMWFMGINLFSKSGNIILGNSIRGYGDTRWMLYTQIFGTVFVIGLALLFVKVFKWGIAGVFVAVIFDEFVRCMINLFRYKYILSRLKKGIMFKEEDPLSETV